MRNATMEAVVDNMLPASGVPDLDIAIATDSDAPAIGRPCHSIPRCRGTSGGRDTTEGDDIPPAQRIPDLDRPIGACRSDTRPIGRPCQGKDNVAMTVIGIDTITITGVPDLDRCIKTRASDVFTIRRPCQPK